MPERVKRQNAWGGGSVVAKKNLRWGMPDWVKKTKCGGVVVAKKFERGMPERVKKTKCK